MAVSHAVRDHDTPATLGTSKSRDVDNSKDPSSNRNACFKQQLHQEKAQPQQQKRQQQQDLCGKAVKVAVKARNMAVKKNWWA